MTVVQVSIYRRFSDLQRSRSVSSCDLCDQTFISEYDLEWHIRKQHTYWCYNCSTTFYAENNYSRTRKEWIHHMTKEHKMKELSFSDIVSEDPVDLVSVTQWTFILPTNELLSYQQINSVIDRVSSKPC